MRDQNDQRRVQMRTLGATIYSGGLKFYQSVQVHIPFQVGDLCSPKQRECVERGSNIGMKGTCGKSCEGIYADVDTVDETIVNSNFDTMITKYKEYKRTYVKNMGFNSSVYKTDFGGLISAIIVKHRKNCECCPGYYMMVNHYSSMSQYQ